VPGSPSADLYDALAPIYDDWQVSTGMIEFSVVAARKLCGVLAREARRRSGAAGAPAFLDLGCGTGSMLLDVRDQLPDWRLAGADASAGMLKQADGKPGADRIVWGQARLDRPLPFPPVFDACGAFYDTINHLPNERALARAFAAMSSVLRPDGLAIFDVTNLLGFRRWWHGISRYSGRGWRITITTAFDEPARTALATTAIAHTTSGSYQMTEHYFDEEQIAGALAAAGLEIESREAWAPFWDEIAGKTWWMARRR
jgi:SAM-dependent methyltransferase